ncbi:MAG: metal-dependent hydrolase [Bacilli bacterium]
MDSASHLSMGIAVGLFTSALAKENGLEYSTATLMSVSIVANLVPDIDVILKFKSNASYIENHRGKTHALVVGLLWVVLISLIAYFFSTTNLSIILLTAFLGIFLHLGTDYLNGYGVQLLWPFYKKWIALGLTHTIDTVIIISHVIAFVLILVFHQSALIIIPTLFICISIYLLFSLFYQLHIKLKLLKKYGKYKRMIVQAKSTPRTWKYVYETTDKNFYIGLFQKNTLTELRQEKRIEVIDKQLELKLMSDHNLKTFIEFTPIYNYTIKELENNVLEIKYYDLRYLVVKKGKLMYQFYCAVHVLDDTIIKSYLGFVLNEDVVDRKLKNKATS